MFKKLRKKIQTKFNKIINSKEYKEFKYNYLKNYYGEYLFTKDPLNDNKKIPAFIIEYEKLKENEPVDSINYYDNLANDKSKMSHIFNLKHHKNYKNKIIHKEYNIIIGDKIKFPNRPGFMLKEIETKKDKMIGFTSYIGTYAENVYSSHILEYEIYKLYCKLKKKSFKKQLLKSKVRNKIYNISNKDIKNNSTKSLKKITKNILLSGKGRKSLLSTQMIVLMKNTDNEYDIKIIQRSSNVAIAPGFYQLIPSGGFELEDNIKEINKEDYSIGCAIFKEYLEELFGIDEFKNNTQYSLNKSLMETDCIKEIEIMLKNGDAYFKFLGLIFNFTNLRYELSFALVINDENYIKNHKFLGNGESINHCFIPNITLSNFENNKEIQNNICDTSILMWDLFKRSDVYERITSVK